MKLKSGLVLLLLLAFSVTGYAQETGSAAETVEKLKAQLLDVQGKEEALRARVQQLDESLKPENIERSLAGIGSTRPEELRESRRRQLTIERDGVQAQLQTLENGRQRLETALANAEIVAYQQSARPTQMLSASSPRRYQWLILGGDGLAALALGSGAFYYRRKLRK
jgi:LPS O-antigen subunit length determinant protein (WzzB/FepE family)